MTTARAARFVADLRSLAALAVATAVPTTCCQAATWVVDGAGGADAETIQAGIDLSSAGDTVMVAPGLYVEGVVANHELTLLGAGPGTTTIDRNGNGNCVDARNSIPFVLDGFDLVGATRTAYGFDGFGVAAGPDAVISNCRVESEFGVWMRGTGELRSTEILHSSGLIIDADSGSSTTIDGCTFMGNTPEFFSLIQFSGDSGTPQTLLVRNCRFLDSGSYGPVVGWAGVSSAGGLNVTVEDCVFVRPGGPIAGRSELPIILEELAAAGGEGDPDVPVAVIRSNTVVQAGTYGIGYPNDQFRLPANCAISGNCVTGGFVGVFLPPPGGVLDVRCNLVWGNTTNWSGGPDPTGKDGNISAPPLYCNVATDNYLAAANSPLLAANNACGIRIGALDQGCDPVSLFELSWARLKACFR